MAQYSGLPTPEERGRIIELQDLLIDHFLQHEAAVADRQWVRAKELEAEINDLLREKEEIENWAVVGSA